MRGKMLSSSVSIIIVTYNCAEVIKECISSCIQYSSSEIIVIDNNSSDDTKKILQKFDNNVIVIENICNEGFTKAINQGIEQAKGEYVFLLNPDAFITENTIDNLLRIIQEDEKIGAVAPVLFFPDGRLQNYTRKFPTPFALFVESFIPYRFWNKFNAYKKYTYSDLDFSEQQNVEQPAGAALLFKNNRKLDENYFIYVSDVDLCKSIYKDGKTIVQTPEARVFHYQSKGGTGNSNHLLRMYLDLDNYFGMQYYFKKHNEKYHLFLYRVLFFLGLSFSVFANLFNTKRNYKITRLFYFLKSYNFRHFESKQKI